MGQYSAPIDNSELKVRKALEIIQAAIDPTGCAVLGILHLNKKADLAAIERLLGSVAFANFDSVGDDGACGIPQLQVLPAGACKVQLVNEGGRHALHPGERRGSSRAARQSQLVRTQSDIDPASMFDRKKPKEKLSAGDWLVQYLQFNGATLKENVIVAAQKEGYSPDAIERAFTRDERCHSRQEGFQGKSMWWLGPYPSR